MSQEGVGVPQMGGGGVLGCLWGGGSLGVLQLWGGEKLATAPHHLPQLVRMCGADQEAEQGGTPPPN